jgi:hypothetical protein
LQAHWPAILHTQLQVTLDALRAWRGTAARARLRGQLAGLRALPHFIAARRTVRRHPEVTDDYLREILTPS